MRLLPNDRFELEFTPRCGAHREQEQCGVSERLSKLRRTVMLSKSSFQYVELKQPEDSC